MVVQHDNSNNLLSKLPLLISLALILNLAGCGGSNASDTPQVSNNNETIISSFSASPELSNNILIERINTTHSGDSIAGEQAYIAAGCVGCHGGKGQAAKSEGNSLRNHVIDMHDLRETSTDSQTLAHYIEAEMPYLNASLCEEQCAVDITAFLLTWLEEAENEVPQVAETFDGKTLYQEHQCDACHGEFGEGGLSFGSEIIIENWGLEALTKKIQHTMPISNPSACGEDCSKAVAAYILSWSSEEQCTGEPLLERRLRLLTPTEYENTIQDVLGIDTGFIAQRLPKTAAIRGYDNNAANTQVSKLHVVAYWELALEIEKQITMESVFNCVDLEPEQCGEELLNKFGLKVFRRPLSHEEKDFYLDLFLSETHVDQGFSLLLKAMLMSPHFIYKSEMGVANGDAFELNQYEIASVLSYTFWGTLPDAVLFQAAETKQLKTKEQIKQQALRLITDSRAQAQFIHFAEQWLGINNITELSKDEIHHPNFNAGIAEAMELELHHFIQDSFLNQSSIFADLFTADYSYLNQALADYYNISGVSSEDVQRVPVDATRGGLLGMGGVLATYAKRDQSSPIARGVFVRERLLCQTFPAPPEAAGEIEPIDPSKPTRERFSQHTDNDGCRSCHEKIDPIGFSFERYDGAGQYREFEGDGLVVDESGFLAGLQRMSDTDYQAYEGIHGLSAILAKADTASTCLVEHFHSYMQGVSQPNRCLVKSVAERWAEGGYTLTELWLESVLSDSFTRRR